MAEGWIDVTLEHSPIVVERVRIVIGIERSICEPFFGNLGEGWRLSQCSAHARRITTMVDIDLDLACFLPSFSECQPSNAITGVAAKFCCFTPPIAARVV
jgi:hypothetical protein